MKIEYLEIKNYKQFTDLTLDLTYPKGHEKEGQPLDKICIIGQSGTGKTNLLEIIKKSVIDFSEQPKNSYLPFNEFTGKKNDDKYIINRFKTKSNILVETFFTKEGSSIIFKVKDKKNHFLDNEKKYFIGTYRNAIKDKDQDIKPIHKNDENLLNQLKQAKDVLSNELIQIDILEKVYNMDSDKNIEKRKINQEKMKLLNKSIESIHKRYEAKNSLEDLKIKNLINRNIIDIYEESDKLWENIKIKIDNYQNERSKYIEYLSSKLLEEDKYSKENYRTDINEWEKQNENLLDKIALKINFILKKFNLKLIKATENQKNYNGLIVQDLSEENIINYNDLSTGTKNLLSTFIPLQTYSPKDSIILIDEPENSFYPDIQRELTDLYMNVGENNQLIMATHSPLIASSFEPWEVVELKFDKNNQIYREKYYKGENHVDNYILDPRMLTWTSILVDIFDLKEDSFSLREQKLMEYGMLKAEIKAMQKGTERDEKIKKFKKLSTLLGLQN
jgi:AAA15 family ATPase/GTPase